MTAREPRYTPVTPKPDPIARLIFGGIPNSPATAPSMDRDGKRHRAGQPVPAGSAPKAIPARPEAGNTSHADAGGSPAASFQHQAVARPLGTGCACPVGSEPDCKNPTCPRSYRVHEVFGHKGAHLAFVGGVFCETTSSDRWLRTVSQL